MCGVAGLIATERPLDWSEEAITKMIGCLEHRGPDDRGVWGSSRAPVMLGHRRLSIVDLSASGHQPMVSQDGRYALALNGEIYNFKQLRRELEVTGCRFRGQSDTEVVLSAIEQWGFEAALKRFTGMYALAVWDELEGQLFLARDRMGEKPLYYGWANDVFVFASELKALRAIPGWSPDLDLDAVGLQMRYTYIPAPYSVYKGISKLKPGTYVKVTLREFAEIGLAVPYWNFDDIALSERSHSRSRAEVADELDQLLTEVIGHQMVADVPLGAFLSGGIDSSLITALMQKQLPTPVKTFSIGFDEAEYNEAHHASAVAEHLGTDHTELYVSAQQARDVIPLLPDIYDEPFSDSSQIPTYLVSKIAREHVTVALSGDGGDEVFGGYNRYLAGKGVWNNIKRVPSPLRRVLSSGIDRTSAQTVNSINAIFRPLLPRRHQYKNVGEKLKKLSASWHQSDASSIYASMIELWGEPGDLVYGAKSLEFLGQHRATFDTLGDFTEQMMFADTVTYLPDDILTKVDRASMAVSLETRVPFLDHRVVEFMWRQPLDFKISGNETKCLLRDILYRHVPKHLIERPKMGFGVPIDQWLRGPLREWAEDLLAEDRLNRQGLFNSRAVQKMWREHLSGQMSRQYLLWPVLMFQAWHERWMP
ncbi:asparagine synthase (glutamine-hydrolyzing) [Luminiphilus sp.]|nr:asparagine synthase (glutamine-hydrolyzing) [Luminiphilus sp.]